MKIGTDGVLLGAWANIVQASSILDIGTGTGLLALMAAQRNTQALIDAVEIDTNAQYQATSNFEQSPWSNRLKLFPCAIQDYLDQATPHYYDSIICNPPYYPQDRHSFIQDKARQQARSTISLDFTTLLDAVQQLLKPSGNFSLILPQQEASIFLEAALTKNWWIAQKVAVIPRVGKNSNRVLLELKQQYCKCVESSITLRPPQNSSKRYTADFEKLHYDFLLFL